MEKELLDWLKMITDEERHILQGEKEIQNTIYTEANDFTIDSKKMLERGKLIDIRTHTRFLPFPKHKHNFIEIMYMCEGRSVHVINDETKLVLEQGDLLFFNQHTYHEILPASKNDIGVNFIVLPEFFDTAFLMMGEENVLSEFIVSSLCNDTSKAQYLHFKVSDVLPIQNLVENMVWSIIHKQDNERKINETTMGLLFLQLLNYTNKLEEGGKRQYENRLVMALLQYIEENYKEGSLTEFATMHHQSVYKLSKLVKAATGHTYKELLQQKRMKYAVRLLCHTDLPVADIILAVGYDNASYFHRCFKEKYGMTPKVYRANNQHLNIMCK